MEGPDVEACAEPALCQLPEPADLAAADHVGEGLASGEAIRQRWGHAGQQLDDDAVWQLEAEYLALALVNLVCMMSPQRIVIGGGVAKQPALLPQVRRRLRELLAGYLRVPELTEPDAIDRYVVAPRLGDQAGVIGALELARDAGRG